MPRFLLKPRWIAFTVVVAALVVVMVNLALWQLRRLDDRQAENAEISARLDTPVQPLDAVVPPGTTLDDADTLAAARWYAATVTGTYDDDATVRVRNRSQSGAPGEHVVTPLVQADGTAVLVNRGFLPSGRGQQPLPPAPAGTVTVEGRVRTTQTRGSLGPVDPADGVLDTLNRVDIARVAQQVTTPLEPVYLELTAPAPEGGLPEPIPAPDLGDGPHLSYAGQWFFFAACAVAGWVVVVRLSMRRDRQRRTLAAKVHEQLGEPLPSSRP